MRVVVAPDSFKGSAAARDAAAAIARGLASRWPSARIELYPMADGGEGTLDALTGWERVAARTVDARRRPITAEYGRDGERALIELSAASGLSAVADALDARRADTFGAGLLIRHALDGGARRILLTLGGSATTDGGSGLLAALGARLLDGQGAEVPPGGAGLAKVASLDVSALDPRASAADWRLACDVDNPLLGERGAAAVFGPQKGAARHDVAFLDAALARWADVLARDLGPVDAQARGMGAAGGAPVALVAAFGAGLVPGARLVAEAIGLERAIAGADLVVTGEGSFDSQSLRGKVVGTVAALARAAGLPVWVVAGRALVDGLDLAAAGIARVGVLDDGSPLPELMAGAVPLIERAAAALARI
ncbi:MAG: glycerate kinase [Bifidobacteriaceae bacterium]|jgi:glycerate kinase|nr:glycerate kinase [Bifidobacteriaceae bacterium]